MRTIESESPQGQKIYHGQDLDQFWRTYGSYADSFAQSCHMFTITFRSLPLPTPAEVADMAARMQGAAVGILQALLALSPDSGRGFIQQVRVSALEIIRAGHAFVYQAFCQGYPKTHDGLLPESDLKLVGGIGEKCQAVRNLPRSMVDLVHSQISRQFSLVSDALQELDEARNDIGGDGDGDEFGSVGYSEDDVKVLMPALGLLKTVKALSKKIAQTVKKYGRSDDAVSIRELEELGEVCQKISPVYHLDQLRKTILHILPHPRTIRL